MEYLKIPLLSHLKPLRNFVKFDPIVDLTQSNTLSEKMAELRPIDISEENKVENFYKNGCGCHYGVENTQCYTAFTKEEICKLRNDIFELNSGERDMLIMGVILANKPVAGEKTTFSLHGRRICRSTFLFCFAISLNLYSTLCNHLKANGPVPREHGNKGKTPHNMFPFETRQNAEVFLKNFADSNALLLPGRVPHYRDEEAKLQLLPSHETKKTVYDEYRTACQNTDLPLMGFSSFCAFWNERLPHIVIAKTMSDLCWVCQEGNTRLIRARAKNYNDEDNDYDELVEEQKAHVIWAAEEQRYYRAQCEKAKEAAEELILKSGGDYDIFKKKPNCSFNGMAHYSWDFAQQVLYPSNPQQPGPIYFKTPRKCGIFGICNDGLNIQFDYLIDEINSTGKGANSTISYVHHFLENFNIGETDAYLHADNCSGIFFTLPCLIVGGLETNRGSTPGGGY